MIKMIVSTQQSQCHKGVDGQLTKQTEHAQSSRMQPSQHRSIHSYVFLVVNTRSKQIQNSFPQLDEYIWLPKRYELAVGTDNNLSLSRDLDM